MYTRMLSGGGSKMASDTLITTSSLGATYTINTGVANMENFIMHGYSLVASQGTKLQQLLRWNKNQDPNKFYFMYCTTSGYSGGAYSNFTSSSQDRNFVMVSVDSASGTVTIKSADLSAAWANIEFTWVAW